MTLIGITPQTGSGYVRWARRDKAPYETLFSRAGNGDTLSDDERVTLYTYLMMNGLDNHDPEIYSRVIEMLRAPKIAGA